VERMKALPAITQQTLLRHLNCISCRIGAATHGNILDEPIKWPDDGIILDVIEERALENDISVTLVFEDGYIKSIQADENYDDAERD